ncbi:hypothetical protein C8R48DRAFT_677810 [Suillus tomentosus]|nr:hypothetical protein C8R48DRAFT_677810 [Suillus tomentosus]
MSSTITPQPSFYGDYEKGEEPTDWLRKYELSLPTTTTDTDKITHFELQCTAASPAETWFASLPTVDKASWIAFRAAFRTRWPPPTQVTLTVAQKKERIKVLVLKEDEIGVMIEEDRGREWGHIRWAKQIARMAQGFNDTQHHLLDVVLDNTPEILRDLLADNYASWMDFEADVAKVSASQLQRTTYTSPPPYRYGYHYNAPMVQTPQTQAAAPPSLPAFQPPVSSLTPQVPQTPQAAHLFAPTAPMSRGNLFYGYRGYPQTPTRRGGSPADRMRTAAQYATIPHHPNSDAGKQAYAQQVQEWHALHGSEAIPNSQRPYPLKPGTSPIGSRECFNCGMATLPPHQSYDCPNEPLPAQEMKWRETVSRLVSRTLAMPTTPGSATNVQYVTSAAPTQYAMPQVPYATSAPSYPPYSYFTDPYETHHGTGNKYGPQQ